jgi:hypothetical protein
MMMTATETSRPRRSTTRMEAVRAGAALRRACTSLTWPTSIRQPMTQEFDVFLSHASENAAVKLGVKAFLQAGGVSVHIDSIENLQLDCCAVTRAQTPQSYSPG